MRGLVLLLMVGSAYAALSADISLEQGLERIRHAGQRLDAALPKLEAQGLGAKTRASKATLDNFLVWIADDRANGQPKRALREVRELVGVAERAADRAEAILAGRIRDFPVPRYRLGTNLIDRAQVIGDRVWPDGHTDRGPVMFTGYGHFQRVRTEVAKLPPLGLNVLQMEFGVWQVLPAENEIGQWQFDNFAKDAANAETQNVGIVVLLSPHYWPKWTFEKWPDLKCGCYAGYCPYHPAAREVLNRYFEALLPKIRNSKALHSIVLTNEPSTRPNPKCQRVRAAFTAWLTARYHGDIAKYNVLAGKKYSSFTEVPITAGDNGITGNNYSLEQADFVRFNREFFADWHRWMAGRVRELAPGVPVHVKIQANNQNWAHDNPSFWSIDPVAFGRMSDYNGNDSVVETFEHDHGIWCDNWWDMEMAYDLQRTMVDKPIFNSENHLQRDRSHGIPQPWAHTYAALWQNAVHGQCGSALWCWERAFDDGKSDFNGLALERPDAFEAYSHCALDLMRLAEALAPIQNLPPKLLLLHSTACFLDGGRDRFASTHRAANFMGVQLGVVTEEAMAEYGRKRPFDTAKVLLVTRTAKAVLPESVLGGIERFRADGGVVMDNLPADESEIFAKLADARSHWPGMDADFVTIEGNGGAPAYGVESRVARYGDRKVMTLVNHLRKGVKVRLPWPGTDLITGEAVPVQFELPPLKPMLVRE